MIKNKGITLEMVTAMMHRAEKLIAYYNNKYNYDMELAPINERAEWNSALELWDVAKANRDKLKGV